MNNQNGHTDGTLTQNEPRSTDDATVLLREIRDMMRSNQAELLNAEEAAAFCGVSRTTWHRLRSAGKVPEPIRLAVDEGKGRFGKVVEAIIARVDR